MNNYADKHERPFLSLRVTTSTPLVSGNYIVHWLCLEGGPTESNDDKQTRVLRYLTRPYPMQHDQCKSLVTHSKNIHILDQLTSNVLESSWSVGIKNG
jgi:hypothetical protein